MQHPDEPDETFFLYSALVYMHTLLVFTCPWLTWQCFSCTQPTAPQPPRTCRLLGGKSFRLRSSSQLLQTRSPRSGCSLDHIRTGRCALRPPFISRSGSAPSAAGWCWAEVEAVTKLLPGRAHISPLQHTVCAALIRFPAARVWKLVLFSCFIITCELLNSSLWTFPEFQCWPVRISCRCCCFYPSRIILFSVYFLETDFTTE